MNHLYASRELEVKDRLYTVRQQKRVLENRLDKYTFRCQNIPDLRKEENRIFKAGIPPALFYLLFTCIMVIILVWCVWKAVRGDATGSVAVGFGFLLSVPMCCLGTVRSIPRVQKVIVAFCTGINLQKEEENLYFKMGNLCTEIAKAEEEIQELERQLKKGGNANE